MIDLIAGILVIILILFSFTISPLTEQSSFQEPGSPNERGLPLHIYSFISSFGKKLRDFHINPNTLTWLGFLFSLLAGLFIATAHFGLATLLACASGAMDILDGFVARTSNRVTKIGMLLDSTLDRYSDAFLLMGYALYYRQKAVILLLVLGALLGSFMMSYSTAKAEAMHLTLPHGQMKRAERWVIQLTGLLFATFTLHFMTSYDSPWNSWPAIVSIGVVAIFSNISAFSRLNKMYRNL